MCYDFVERLTQSGQADSIAVLDDNGVFTYEEFRCTVNTSRDFIRRMNIPVHSRIILCLPNGMRAIAMLLAIVSLDMIAVPVSVDTPADTLYQMQIKVEAIATVTSQDKEQFHIQLHRFTLTEIYGERGCLILFTSGTTGCLKGVELSSGALLSRVAAVADYMHTGKFDRFYILKDYVHCSSLIAEIFVALYCGASVCLYNPRQQISLTRKRIAEVEPTIIGVNPWFLELICKQKRFVECYDSLNIVACSGSILSGNLAEEARAFFRNADLINVYGLTEAGSRVSAQLPYSQHGSNTVGKPIMGVEVQVQRHNEVDISGEVLVKSSGMMLRYYNDPIATQEKIQDGWLRTGDSGYFDEAGDLVITGRMDDVIISGANKIDPFRVENVIKQCPNITDAVVVGVRQDLIGEVAVALVVYEGAFDDDIRAFIDRYCKERLYGFECPKRFFSVTDIPRTHSGKVSKGSLSALLEKIIRKEQPISGLATVNSTEKIRYWYSLEDEREEKP